MSLAPTHVRFTPKSGQLADKKRNDRNDCMRARIASMREEDR
jgi:hypothetical protein